MASILSQLPMLACLVAALIMSVAGDGPHHSRETSPDPHVPVYEPQWVDTGGLGDVTARGTPLDRYNWDFVLDSQTSWAASHVTNPLCVYMLTQDPLLTMFIFTFFEPVETWNLLLFSGHYVMFIGDEAPPESEPPADSQVGDILGGFLGMLLARLITLTYAIPSWTPYWRHSNPRLRWIWVKRMLQLIMVEVAFSPINWTVHVPGFPPIKAGSLWCVLWLTVCWALFRRWNWSADEVSFFWGGKPDDTDFRTAYLAWFGSAIMLVSSTFFFFLPGYFQVWTVWGALMALHLYVLAWQNRLHELWYFLIYGFTNDGLAARSVPLNVQW